MLSISTSNKNAGIFLFLYVLILFFFCSRMSPLYGFNYWADVNIYFTIGKGIWNGKVVYRDLFDHKGPLIFFIYGFGYLLSHKTFLGVFILQVCFQFVSIVFVYRTIRLFLKRNLSLLLSLFFPIFLFAYSLDGGCAEEFTLPFQAISFYFFIRYFKDKSAFHSPRVMFVHGAMVMLIFFIKLNLIVFSFFPLLFIFIDLLHKRLYKNLFQNLFYFIGGAFVASLPVFIYFLWNNAWSDFWSSYIEFNQLYGTLKIVSYKDFILGVLVGLFYHNRLNYILFSFVFLGLIYFTFSSVLKNKLGRVALPLSFGLLIFTVFAARIFLPYYMMPVIIYSTLGCIMVGLCIDKFWDSEKRFNLISIVSVFVFLIVGIMNSDVYKYSPKVLIENESKLGVVETFAREITSTPDATLLCATFDWSIDIYTQTGIVPNVRYFFFPNIRHEDFPDLRDSQTRYIDNQEVDYVITNSKFKYFDYYTKILQPNYQVVDTYDTDGRMYYLYKRKELK